MFSYSYILYAMLFIVLATFTVKWFLQKWITSQEKSAAILFSNENEVISVLVKRLEEGSPYRNFVEMLLQAYIEHTRVANQIDLNDWLATTSISAKKLQEPHITTDHALFYFLAFFSIGLGILLGALDISHILLQTSMGSTSHMPQVSSGIQLVIMGVVVSMISMAFSMYFKFKNERNLLNFERFTLASMKMFLQTAEEIGYQSPKQLLQLRQIIQPLLSGKK